MPDRLKPSRMLLRLDAEIAAASTQLQADCKRAERAAYLARLGRHEQARAAVDELRRRYDSHPNVLISAWLNLVQGVVGHFSNMDPAAHDKILRAHALSAAASLTQHQALCAGWLAHLDYLRADFLSMASHVVESLRLAGVNDHSTQSRASLVVAQAYHLAGRPDLAVPWYSRVHRNATAEGDDATLSALMHNMAWLRAQHLRVRDCIQADGAIDDQHALLGAESTENFDLLIGSSSLKALVPVLRAQIYAARGQYELALTLYETNLQSAVGEGLGRLQADLIADQAWCRVQLGQHGAALDDASVAEAGIDANGQFDDRALAHGRLSQVFEVLGNSQKAASHAALARDAWSGHTALQAQILSLLRNSSETSGL